MRTWAVAVVVLALGAAALFGWLGRPDGPDAVRVADAQAVEAQPAPDPVQPAERSPRTAVGAPDDGPDPLAEADFALARVGLERLARAGSADAALRLAEVLQYCPGHEVMTREAREERMVETMAYFPDAPVGGVRLDDPAAIRFILDMQSHLDGACAGADLLHDADPERAALEWIELAVQAGDTRAMARYAEVALAPYNSNITLIVDEAEEVLRLRDRSRMLLERALAAGEPEALLAAAHAHLTGGIRTRDPARTLAYLDEFEASGAPVHGPRSALVLLRRMAELALEADETAGSVERPRAGRP